MSSSYTDLTLYHFLTSPCLSPLSWQQTFEYKYNVLEVSAKGLVYQVGEQTQKAHNHHPTESKGMILMVHVMYCERDNHTYTVSAPLRGSSGGNHACMLCSLLLSVIKLVYFHHGLY